MNCIVTAGPTFERLDRVRRLTNLSTGKLGTELANYLAARGHEVTLLIGEQATWSGKRTAQRVETFGTTVDLHDRLQALASPANHAIFHAAAVSDFTFGKIWRRAAAGKLIAVKADKISTREGTLLAELVATPKIIAKLRDWFPQSKLVGWKYEVEGDRATVLAAAETQIRECLTDACVANGPAYGDGFGLAITAGKTSHLGSSRSLFGALEKLLR